MVIRMARGKKKEELSLEEKLEQALVPVEEQPYEVPENWCFFRFTSLIDIEGGTQPPKSQFVEEPMEGYVRLVQIRDFASEKYAVYVPDTKKLRKFNKDDVMIARYGASIGRICTGLEGAYNVALAKTIFSKEILNRDYVYWMLQSETFQNPLRIISRSAQAGFNKEDLSNFAMPFPPLKEQERIVERIESLFAKLNEAKEKLEDSIRNSSERRNAILQKAYSGTLTEKWRQNHLSIKNCVIENIGKYSLDLAKKDKKFIEDGQSKLKKVMMSSNVCWYKGDIGAISVVTNGSTPSRKCDDYWNGDIPWVSSGEVRNNIIEYTEERITQEGYDNSSVKLLPIGTVLIAMIGEGKTRGQSAILNIEATTNQNIAAIVIEHGQINPKFLWYWLQKQYKRNREKGAGSGPQALNCQRVRELDFIIPPLEEQNEIVKIIDNLMNKENSIINSIETTLDNIEGIRKSILARAFRGELGTNNPKEESSIELLKKILAKA